MKNLTEDDFDPEERFYYGDSDDFDQKPKGPSLEEEEIEEIDKWMKS